MAPYPHSRPRPRLARAAGLILVGLLALFMVPLPPASAHVVLTYALPVRATSAAPLGPLSALTTRNGAGACASTAVGAVPFGAGSPRGTITATEPHGCRSGTTLTFDPALSFPNGLAVTAGHTLDVELTLLSVTGTTAMARLVDVYIQESAAPLTKESTNAVITGGAITTATTSAVAVPAGTDYGVGLEMRLTRQGAVSTVTITALLYLDLDDGGRQEAVETELVTIPITY